MASRGLRIFGSGTRSTRTSFVPYQQSAFMRRPRGWPVGRRDFAGFQQLFESAQVLADLACPRPAACSRAASPELAAGRAVLQVRTRTRVPRPAPASSKCTDPALTTSEPSSERQAISLLGTSLMISRVPLDGRAGRAFRAVQCEMRVRRSARPTRGAHELRQVLEVAPERVQLARRAVDRDDSSTSVTAALPRSTRARVAAVRGGVEPERLVDVAVRR